MELVLLKNPLIISAKTLKSLTNNFKEYTKKPVYSATDEQAYEESQAAADLINEAIRQISVAKEELKSLVAQIKCDYDKIQAPGEREDFSDALEKLEIETNFNEILGTATEMTYMLKTRLTEVISHRNRMGRRLGLIPAELNIIANTQTSKNIEHELTDNEWISDDSNESTEANKMQGSRTCNNIKPPALMLPKFFGVEEDFPEFWAVYETLVHKSTTLSTVEKMLLLKDSLKGNSDSAIKGIQLVPQNYGWMIDALKKKYGNKPINRARIVHRLTILTPATKNAESCAYVFDKIQMLVNQMVSAGQDVRKTNDAMWTEMILDKFPYDIVKNVLIAIKGREEVTIEEIMENIEKEILAISYVQSRMKVHQRKFESTADAKPTKTSAVTTRPLCVFCNKAGHYAANCRSVADIQTRRNIVMDKQLCWKCYSNTHNSKDCSRPNCHICGRAHQGDLRFDRQRSFGGTSNTQCAARKNNSTPFKRTEPRTNSNWKNNTPYNLRPRDKSTTQNQKLRDDMEDLRNEMDKKIQKWKTDAYQVRSEAKTLKTTNNTGLKAQLQAANDRIEHTVNDSANKIRELSSQVRRLEEDLTDTKYNLTQKESDLEKTTNRTRTLGEQNAQLQIDANKCRSKLDAVQRENDVLKSANANLDSENNRFKNRLKTAEDSIKKLKNSLNHLKQERGRLQNSYKDKAKQADHLQQLSQQFDSKLQKLRQELQETLDKLITADTERPTFRTELAKLQQELKFVDKQMQTKTDKYQSTVDDLANAHRVSENGRLNALQELESRKYEMSDLQSRLESTEQRLITLQQGFINVDSERDSLADALRRFQASNTTFESCLGEICQKFREISSPKLEWTLPPTTLNNSILVSLRYLQSAKEITEQSTCLKPHTCDHSRGVLSKRLLANPHCWPNGTITSLGHVTYAVLATVIMIHACMRRWLTKAPDAGNHEKHQRYS